MTNLYILTSSGLLDEIGAKIIILENVGRTIQNRLGKVEIPQNSTSRSEADKCRILSGVFEGRTTGTPISVMVENNDQHSKDYDALKDVYRPSHADFSYEAKYGIRDHRGGGRSSGRETIGRVIAGAVASKILSQKGISFCTYVNSIGDVFCDPGYFEEGYILKNPLCMPDRTAFQVASKRIEELREQKDSVGSSVICVVRGVPAGLGDPVFEKLDANLAKAIFSIGAVKAFEVGDGFSLSMAKGSEANDGFAPDENGNITQITNHSGGIIGGISTGADIVLHVYFKPTPSIASLQKTADRSANAVDLEIKGRHDPVIGPRAAVVVESMAAITLFDAYLKNLGARNE